MRTSRESERGRASILVGLLWCVALLALLVVGTLHTSRLDLRVVKNHSDSIQAHYLALAGIEKAKALLYQDDIERRGAGRHHQGHLYDAPEDFRDVTLGRGSFRVFRQGGEEEGGVVYGIMDEESRLNLNHASPDELGKLSGIDPEAATSITAYRSKVNEFRTARELLAVRGVSPDLFFGEDRNYNGLLDPEEDDGDESFPPDNRDGLLDGGWSAMLTVHSSVRDVNASGQSRIHVQEASQDELAAVPGIGSELARAIVAHRGQNQLESLADLLEVRPPGREGQPPSGQPQQSPPAEGTPAVPRAAPTPMPPARMANPGRPAGGSPASGGQPLISEDLLMEIADHLTVNSERNQAGAVNINTAAAQVLACLPGISHDLAEAIVAHRRSEGYFTSVAGLLKVRGMDRQIFKQVAPRVSVRSETFRILSEGLIPSTGARKRIEVIVRLAPASIETLHYREDL